MDNPFRIPLTYIQCQTLKTYHEIQA